MAEPSSPSRGTNIYCLAATDATDRQPVSGGTLISTVTIAKHAKATADTIHAALLFFKSARLATKKNLEVI
jgi:hypothetical protein